MANNPFDPETLPIDSLAGEEPVAPERLHGDWLRRRFREAHHWTPEQFDEALHRRSTPTDASVLIPLIQRADGVHLLLTRRTAHLTDHAGQISFPGGRAEAYDASPVDTALRETEEEIGLARAHVEVIGVLPEYFTVTGYRVTPVVGLVTPPCMLRPDPNEVAEVFEVPLAFLMNGTNHQRRSFEPQLAENTGGGAGRQRRSFYAMPYQDYFIWGATAGMLRNLFHFLRS